MPSVPDDADLRRYWVEFELPSRSSGLPETAFLNEFPDADAGMRHYLGNGVGVTGYDLDDCLALITDALHRIEEQFRAAGRGDVHIALPPVSKVDEQPDVSALADRLPIRGVSAVRGIWYPSVGPFSD